MTGFCNKNIQILQICNLSLHILKVEHKSFPIMYHYVSFIFGYQTWDLEEGGGAAYLAFQVPQQG